MAVLTLRSCSKSSSSLYHCGTRKWSKRLKDFSDHPTLHISSYSENEQKVLLHHVVKADLPLVLVPSPLLPSSAFPSCNACCISSWRPCRILLSAQRRSSPEDTRKLHPRGPEDQTEEAALSFSRSQMLGFHLDLRFWQYLRFTTNTKNLKSWLSLTFGSLECSGHKTWSLLQ